MPSRRRTRSCLPRPVSLLVVAALVVAASGCSGDAEESDKQAVPTGVLVEASVGVEGRSAFVQTPDGRLDLTIGTPRADLPVYDETYDRAADGDSLVGVAWEVDFRSRPAGLTDPTQDPVQPSFTLVADGEEYPLDEAMLTANAGPSSAVDVTTVVLSGGVFVGVEGTPSDLAIEVDYDGLVQSVGPDTSETDLLQGVAGPLYRSQQDLATRALDCGRPRIVPGSGLSLERPDCQVTMARLPYQQAVGWAPEGSTWLSFVVVADGGAVATYRRGGRQEVYTVDDGREPFFSVDGTAPSAVVDLAGDGYRWLVVVEVPADGGAGSPGGPGGVLEIQAAFPTTGTGDGDAPSNPTIPATWRVAL